MWAVLNYSDLCCAVPRSPINKTSGRHLSKILRIPEWGAKTTEPNRKPTAKGLFQRSGRSEESRGDILVQGTETRTSCWGPGTSRSSWPTVARCPRGTSSQPREELKRNFKPTALPPKKPSSSCGVVWADQGPSSGPEDYSRPRASTHTPIEISSRTDWIAASSNLFFKSRLRGQGAGDSIADSELETQWWRTVSWRPIIVNSIHQCGLMPTSTKWRGLTSAGWRSYSTSTLTHFNKWIGEWSIIILLFTCKYASQT